MIDLVTDQLSLNKSLDRSLSELSGGELQRLAVAIAANKDADYYFFDEPSSYNDIYQRLAVARTIKQLASDGKDVMVVEHDLTLLDYLQTIFISCMENQARMESLRQYMALEWA